MSSSDAIRIKSAEAKLIRIPLEQPRGDAIQKFSALELPTVRLHDEAGRVGLGFGYTIGEGGRAILGLIQESLLPKVYGEDSRAIGRLHHLLNAAIHALTPGCISSTAIAAIDVALWDLRGRQTETPLWIMLGGAQAKVPIYNTHVGWLNRPLDELLNLCAAAVKQGFRALKLKVGKPDPEEDRERVAKVRESVGPQVRLMIDANQSWYLDEAIKRLKLLEPFDLTWVEEPLLASDIDGYRALGRYSSIPRAGGESLYSPADFLHYVRRGGLDILQPDIARIGGITNAVKVCNLAQTARLRIAPHVSPELSLSIAAAYPHSMFIEFIPQMSPLLKTPIKIENGYALPSNAPGHGIEFNQEAEERFTASN